MQHENLQILYFSRSYFGPRTLDRPPGNYSAIWLMRAARHSEATRMLVYGAAAEQTRLDDLVFRPVRWRLLASDLRAMSSRRRTVATVVLTELGEHYWHAFLAAKLLRCPLVYRTGGVFFGAEFIRSSYFSTHFKRYRMKLRLSDRVVTTRDGTPIDLFMHAMGLTPTRYVSFLNGFPEFPPPRPAAERRGVLCLSRLSDEKNVDLVIEAFARAAPHIDIRHKLVIAGDGPAARACRAKADRLGVAGRVEFSGHIDGSARVELIRASALIVAAFANNPVIEGIAARVPVVTVELGETAELYRAFPNVHVVPYGPGGCGPVPPPAREPLVALLAEAMIARLTSPVDYDYAIDDSFSWDVRIERELALYRALGTTRPREGA